jgi:hypothetical protein
MKKSMMLLLSAFAVLSLASCGGSKTSSTAAKSTTTSSAKTSTSKTTSSGADTSSAATSSTAASSAATSSSYVPESFDSTATYDVTIKIKVSDYTYASGTTNYLYLLGSWDSTQTPGALVTYDSDNYLVDATSDIKGGVYSFDLYTEDLKDQVKKNRQTISFTANGNKTLKYTGSMAAGFTLEA